jgi:hypothetical protein
MRALPLVLILLVEPPHAAAQPYVCRAVQRGDTAARVALRLTGDASNRYEPWFEIVDPDTRTIRPKTAYDRILPGWEVCLPQDKVTGTLAAANDLAPAPVPAEPVDNRSPDAPVSTGLKLVLWLGTALLMALGASVVAKRDLEKQQEVRGRMKRLGDAFVREFERPLLRHPCGSHPIRSQLRCIPRRGRLEVLLAPNGRRTYPNVSDHRKNLEYDVERVLHLMGGELSLGGRPYARGPWVVIPFQLKAG